MLILTSIHILYVNHTVYSRANFVIEFNYCCLSVILIDPTVQQLCRLPALKCYIESWGKCVIVIIIFHWTYCWRRWHVPAVPLPLTIYIYRHKWWTVLAESFVQSSSSILMPLSSWAIKLSWLGNMEREIDHEIAAVHHRYGAEKAKPSIALSQSLYTPFMFMPAAAVNSNDCRKFMIMNPVSFDNIII